MKRFLYFFLLLIAASAVTLTCVDSYCACNGKGCQGINEMSSTNCQNIYKDDDNYVTLHYFSLSSSNYGCGSEPETAECLDGFMEDRCGLDGFCSECKPYCSPYSTYCGLEADGQKTKPGQGWVLLKLDPPTLLNDVRAGVRPAMEAPDFCHTEAGFFVKYINGTWGHIGTTHELTEDVEHEEVFSLPPTPVEYIRIGTYTWQFYEPCRTAIDYVTVTPADGSPVIVSTVEPVVEQPSDGIESDYPQLEEQPPEIEPIKPITLGIIVSLIESIGRLVINLVTK